MRFRLFVAATAMLSASLAAHADTVTYDFTYSSTSGNVAGETVTGNGSFTVSHTPGSRMGTLTAFSFTDTIDSSEGDSTFLYTGLGALSSSTITLTLGGRDLADAMITTGYETGTNGGRVNFGLQDVGGTINDSTSTSALDDFPAGNTVGGGTVTFVSATSVTPEPSSFLLLGTGLLGMAGVLRKRFVWLRMPENSGFGWGLSLLSKM